MNRRAVITRAERRRGGGVSQEKGKAEQYGCTPQPEEQVHSSVWRQSFVNHDE